MKNIQINSKPVEPGDIFVAIPCENVEQNISDAFQKGAGIVFAENSTNKNAILVKDARLLVSKLSRFNYPKHPETCVAITGTNGKSSVSHFLSQIWTYLGKKSANLGTLGLFIDQQAVKPEEFFIPNLTTPDAVTFHKIMEYLQNSHVTHCVFEASSHAIEQKRCHSAVIKAAAFTNLASDHLDYHKTREAYFATKLKLFSEILPPNMPAVVSLDFPDVYNAVYEINKNLITFGISEKNDVRAGNIRNSSKKIIFDLIYKNEVFNNIELNLLGDFQVMNILCAVALGLATGFDIDFMVKVLPKIKPLEGRMELVKTFNGGDIYVDFAHTSEGLRTALQCFRKVCRNRLICVFGCGGNRDVSKRPEIGRIAHENADICVVTDDNPRQESPEEIRRQIIETCPNAIEIGSRREAIKYAVSLMQPGDIVAVMGRGHETHQIYADESIPFNDKEVILETCINRT